MNSRAPGRAVRAPGWRFALRARGWAAPILAALHAALIAWVAWYLTEQRWASISTAASPTPLPPLVFRGSWIAGAIVLVAAGVALGADLRSARWQGLDPTLALPRGGLERVVSAWAASVVLLALAALGPVPVYLSLHELGAVRAMDVVPAILAQSALVVVSPLAGILVAGAWRRGEARW
jgi:hypothetical protein